MTKYITDGAGMATNIVECIDALLELLPGHDPEFYVTPNGRPDIEKIKQGKTPHSHSTSPIADIVVGLWVGHGPLSSFIGHADNSRKVKFGEAMMALAGPR